MYVIIALSHPGAVAMVSWLLLKASCPKVHVYRTAFFFHHIVIVKLHKYQGMLVLA